MGGGPSSESSSPNRGRGAVPSRRQQQERARAEKRKQEEAMMRLAEDEDQVGLFARSSSGNIIRSLSGQGVTSRAGRQAQENIRAGFEGRPARDMDKMFPMDTGGDDQSPINTGESSPEVVDDDVGTAQILTKGPARRRTRGKRFGQAGDFGEGILVRNTQR